MKILFVCAGNTCRSPMAEALAKRLLAESTSVESAGMETADGMMATEEAVTVMRELGIDISAHRSRVLDGLNLADYHLIVALSPRIAQQLTSARKVPQQRVRVLALQDPYGRGLAAYRQCLTHLSHALPFRVQPCMDRSSRHGPPITIAAMGPRMMRYAAEYRLSRSARAGAILADAQHNG